MQQTIFFTLTHWQRVSLVLKRLIKPRFRDFRSFDYVNENVTPLVLEACEIFGLVLHVGNNTRGERKLPSCDSIDGFETSVITPAHRNSDGTPMEYPRK